MVQINSHFRLPRRSVRQTFFFLALLTVPISQANAGPFEDEYKAASTALAAGRTNEAQLKFESALKLAPAKQATMVRWFLASTYAIQEQPDKAISEYLVIMQDPQVPKEFKASVALSLAMSYSAIGQTTKAADVLQTTLNSGVDAPLKDTLQLELGTTYIYQKRYPEARQVFEKALAAPETSPTYASSFALRVGTTYLLEGNFDAASEKYRELLARPSTGTTTPDQMASAQTKQAAHLELSQVGISQALEQQREVLKSKFLAPQVESLVKENIQQLEQLQAKFLVQFVVTAPPKPIAKAATSEAHPREVLQVGNIAPDFTLVDANGKVQKLSDYRGKKQVLLTFFPKCFTGGCINHLSSLRDQKADFDASNVQILAVSVDAADGEKGQRAFAKQWDLDFPFLPDTERKISLLYGAAHKPDDMASRMSVLIGTDGTISLIDKQVRVATHGQDLLVKMKDKNLLAKRD